MSADTEQGFTLLAQLAKAEVTVSLAAGELALSAADPAAMTPERCNAVAANAAALRHVLRYTDPARVPYQYVTTPGGATEALRALSAEPVVALDIETTGLSFRKDRARLI